MHLKKWRGLSGLPKFNVFNVKSEMIKGVYHVAAGYILVSENICESLTNK
jgi:hypothetical protein